MPALSEQSVFFGNRDQFVKTGAQHTLDYSEVIALFNGGRARTRTVDLLRVKHMPSLQDLRPLIDIL